MFHIPIFSFSVKTTHLPKHTVIVYVTGPSALVMTASTTLHHLTLMKTPESLNRFALRNEHFASYKAEKRIALNEALHSKHDNVINLVGARNTL